MSKFLITINASSPRFETQEQAIKGLANALAEQVNMDETRTGIEKSIERWLLANTVNYQKLDARLRAKQEDDNMDAVKEYCTDEPQWLKLG